MGQIRAFSLLPPPNLPFHVIIPSPPPLFLFCLQTINQSGTADCFHAMPWDFRLPTYCLLYDMGPLFRKGEEKYRSYNRKHWGWGKEFREGCSYDFFSSSSIWVQIEHWNFTADYMPELPLWQKRKQETSPLGNLLLNCILKGRKEIFQRRKWETAKI